MTDTTKAIVEQCDREAALRHRLYTSSLPETDYRAKRLRELICSGEWDNSKTVLIFAEHRIEATATLAARVEALEASNATAAEALDLVTGSLRFDREDDLNREVLRRVTAARATLTNEPKP
ncbi:hypothetical protein [Sphingomonas baiyangensis]|uniref:Uncharacterized protein n=1 Tax=Sphingomonas baiyangensis TaxID=2572576 RepID=A0A4U1L2X9_9SPHN|nr:hypothetical protein [Sphingomonas baiyangensis]TKD50543.1 hypothetical protein FBR43_07040 [Sphingomonas baiyangensis]